MNEALRPGRGTSEANSSGTTPSHHSRFIESGQSNFAVLAGFTLTQSGDGFAFGTAPRSSVGIVEKVFLYLCQGDFPRILAV